MPWDFRNEVWHMEEKAVVTFLNFFVIAEDMWSLGDCPDCSNTAATHIVKRIAPLLVRVTDWADDAPQDRNRCRSMQGYMKARARDAQRKAAWKGKQKGKGQQKGTRDESAPASAGKGNESGPASAGKGKGTKDEPEHAEVTSVTQPTPVKMQGGIGDEDESSVDWD